MADDVEKTEEASPDDAPLEEAGEVTAEDLDAARRECEELMDRLKRTAADYQNYQKRTARRIEEAVRFAVRDVVLDLVPVIDNFERALESAAEGEGEGLRQGIQLVHDQLLAALAKHGVAKIEAEGRPFDPEEHEAVSHVPSQAHPAGTVMAVMQEGYRLGEHVIRPSRVAVSSGPADQPGE